jgi:hypothetical protein
MLSRGVNEGLVPRLEERLGLRLARRDKEWLVEQILRLGPGAHDPGGRREGRTDQPASRPRPRPGEAAEFLEGHRTYARARPIDEGYLAAGVPAKGARGSRRSSVPPEALLAYAKDVLFGEESTNTRFDRIERELLTLALPRQKAGALDFMQAATELGAVGTWRDPESVSDDSRAENVVLEVEYGEVAGEWIGHGTVRALGLIKIDVEQSTLI